MTKKRKDNLLSIAFLLPALTLLAVYIIYPIISTLILSFQTWKGIYGAPKEFVGFVKIGRASCRERV